MLSNDRYHFSRLVILENWCRRENGQGEIEDVSTKNCRYLLHHTLQFAIGYKLVLIFVLIAIVRPLISFGFGRNLTKTTNNQKKELVRIIMV
jgi:hypothetical protein